MKRVLSLVLVLVLVLGTMPMAFADTSAVTAGEQLKAYGLLNGDEDGNLNEDKELTRAEMMAVLARLMGKDEEAKAYAIPSSFTDVDADNWAAGYIAFAEKMGWTNGVGEGKFDPNGKVTLQQAAAYMLRALGYDVEWANVVEKAKELKLLDGLTAGAGDVVKRADVFEVALKTIETPKKGSDKKLGEELGVLKPEVVVPEVKAVKLDSAVALNSKVIEVSLAEAGEKVDASVFAVKDADNKTIAVKEAKFADWDTDKETVLLTLEADTTVGTLYTVTSGDTSANFGGKAKDEDAATVKSVTSTDYNEVTVEFNEAIDLSTVKVTLAEKYGDKATLSVLDMKYDGNSKVVLTTAEQKSNTLYAATVENAKDLAGNVMEKDDTNTFVGTVKPTDDVKVVKAASEDYNQVVVSFDQKLADVTPSMFTVKEKYGDKKELAVLDAKIIADATDTATTIDSDDKAVLLTVADQKASTLYEVSVKDVKSIYDTKLDTDNDTATFVGQAKPDSDFALSTVEATSNTEVKLTFANKLDKDTAESIANYTIKEKYGDKKVLTITKAELDEKVVTLTVEAMDTVLYELVASNDIKDIYGNNVDSDADTKTFVGKKVADKFSSVKVVSNDETSVTIEFDQNVGSNATDVSFYTIDNEVGYPEKAETVSGNDKQIKLTIPNTVVGKVYKLTVKEGVENADGVASTDELTTSFAGKGDTAAKAKVEAVIALNNQVLNVHLDQDISDNGIDGLNLYKSTDGKKFELASSASTGFASVSSVTTYEDPANNKVLVVVAPVDTFKKGADYDTANLNVIDSDVDTDNDNVDFALNDDDATPVKVDSIMALDSKTIRVYFNQYVPTIDSTKLSIAAKDGTPASATFSSTPVAVDDNKVAYDFATPTTLTSEIWEATITAGFAVNGQILFSTETDDLTVEFAGNDDSSLYIDDVYAVMTDKKHIKVYYPEKMDSTTVQDTSNYTFTHITTASIAKVELDSDTNVATITLNAAYTGSETKDVLTIKKNVVKNAAGTKFVEDSDGNAITTEFAISTEDAPKVKIDSLAVTTAGVITVTFDQNVNAASVAAADFKVYKNDTEITISSVADGTANDDEVVLNVGTLAVNDVIKVELQENTNIKGVYDNEYVEDGNSEVIVVE